LKYALRLSRKRDKKNTSELSLINGCPSRNIKRRVICIVFDVDITTSFNENFGQLIRSVADQNKRKRKRNSALNSTRSQTQVFFTYFELKSATAFVRVDSSNSRLRLSQSVFCRNQFLTDP
jgi:hypothetical protein